MSSPFLPSYPITSTQPPPTAFFRNHKQRQLSSSSFSSLDPSASSCSDDSSESEDSSSDDEGDLSFSSISSLARSRRSLTPTGRSTAGAHALARTAPAAGGSSRSPSLSSLQSHRRVHLKLSFLILRARQSLASSSFAALQDALRSLATALPTDLRSLGAFLPILDRLATDLGRLGGEDKGREYRKGLSKEDAKALTSIRQRWTVGAGAGEKGKGKASSENEWVERVRVVVTEKPKPACLLAPYDAPTSALLSALESLLMPSSLPRVSLSGLNLTGPYLARWPALKHAQAVLGWYLSFDRDPVRPDELLAGVRSLDLSENRLEEFPPWLPAIFPCLETLSLAHNAFRFLPPAITLFHHLRRLRTHGNQLARPGRQRGRVKHNTKEVVRELRGMLMGVEVQVGPESLAVACARVVRRARREAEEAAVGEELGTVRRGNAKETGAGSGEDTEARAGASPSRTATPTEGASLPVHLERLVGESYVCCSCGRFVPTTSPAWLGPLYERVHHLDPGVSLPAKMPPSPSLALGGRPPLARAGESSASASSRSSSVARPPQSPTALSSPMAAVAPLAIPPARPGMASRTSSSSFASNSPPLSTSASPAASPVQAAFPPAPHRLTLEEKVYLLLMGRGLDVTPFVVGDEEGYRFCAGCARKHLGLDMRGECGCEVCGGERRWREEEEGTEGGVMRWLRRKVGRGRGAGA